MPARHIKITGRVQGVFFRAHAKEKADALGITGWVRNMDDGAVEIHAEGSPEALAALERWCAEGPDAAEVERVEAGDAESSGSPSFEVLRP